MNALILDATEYTPLVILDPTNNRFEITGESSPEDSVQFYSLLGKWFKEFMDQAELSGNSPGAKEITLAFQLSYITSSSLRSIYDLLSHVNARKTESQLVKVKWVHDREDEDIANSGLQLSRMLKLPFEFVAR